MEKIQKFKRFLEAEELNFRKNGNNAFDKEANIYQDIIEDYTKFFEKELGLDEVEK